MMLGKMDKDDFLDLIEKADKSTHGLSKPFSSHSSSIKSLEISPEVVTPQTQMPRVKFFSSKEE